MKVSDARLMATWWAAIWSVPNPPISSAMTAKAMISSWTWKPIGVPRRTMRHSGCSSSASRSKRPRSGASSLRASDEENDKQQRPCDRRRPCRADRSEARDRSGAEHQHPVGNQVEEVHHDDGDHDGPQPLHRLQGLAQHHETVEGEETGDADPDVGGGQGYGFCRLAQGGEHALPGQQQEGAGNHQGDRENHPALERCAGRCPGRRLPPPARPAGRGPGEDRPRKTTLRPPSRGRERPPPTLRRTGGRRPWCRRRRAASCPPAPPPPAGRGGT